MTNLPRLLASLLAALLLSVVAIPAAPQADALSSFDAEVLRLLNNHRRNLGLRPFVEWQPLSDAAMNHSNWMASGTGSSCTGGGGSRYGHDSLSNIGSRGMPPQTTSYGENIFYQCGYDTFSISAEFDRLTYSGLPSNCRQGYGSTSAMRMFCGWINSGSHRGAIENPAYTHIGLGTVRSNKGGGEVHMWSTNRFAAAPVTAAPAPAPAPSATTCNGRRVTVDIAKGQRPTEGSDVIIGTAGADVIRALGGNDTICSGGGNDLVYAGTGNDYIDGGGGNDRLFGGSGADTMLGGSGNDKLHGNFGNDEIRGQGGDDKLFGYGNDDRMYGGDGNDVMHGNFGDDRMWGGRGNDKMWGYGDNDLMYGEDGNDLVVGNRGNDTLHGGNGGDTLRGAAGNDRLFGEGGNDILEGNFNPDYLVGGLGNDRMDGGPHGDTCVGQSGTDSASRCERVESTP